jgi:hypothetical protein
VKKNIPIEAMTWSLDNAIPFNRERPAPKETGARRRAERDGR